MGILSFFKRNNNKVTEVEIKDPAPGAETLYVTVLGAADLIFRQLKEKQLPVIQYIAIQFFLEIPPTQIYTDINSAYNTVKKEHPDTHFFIMELSAGKLNNKWWSDLKKDLRNVTSFNHKDTLQTARRFSEKDIQKIKSTIQPIKDQLRKLAKSERREAQAKAEQPDINTLNQPSRNNNGR